MGSSVFKIISGTVLALAGFLSYFLFFARYPDLRDFPYVNLPTIILGVVLTFSGAHGLFRNERGFLLKTGGVGGVLVSCAALGLFSYYVFVLSSTMPTTGIIPDVGDRAPDFALTDQSGKSVSLASFKGREVILAFYRGYW